MTLILSPAAGAVADTSFSSTALAADLTVTASTTLADTGLSVAVGASSTEVWVAEFRCLISAANATMDVKFNITTPASSTVYWGPLFGASATTSGWSMVTTATAAINLKPAGGSDYTFGTTGTAGQMGVHFLAVIRGGGTAGNVMLQFAQNTSDAGNLVLARGSNVSARRVTT